MQIKAIGYLMSATSKAERRLELEIFYFRFQLHQRMFDLLYSKSLEFNIRKPGFLSYTV